MKKMRSERKGTKKEMRKMEKNKEVEMDEEDFKMS